MANNTAPKQKIGSIISGTSRPQDLIPAFLATLKEVLHPTVIIRRNGTHEASDRVETRIAELESNYPECYGDILQIAYDLNWLREELWNESPAYMTFEKHPDREEDFGYWLISGWRTDLEAGGGLVVHDLNDIPFGHKSDVILVLPEKLICFAHDCGRQQIYWEMTRSDVPQAYSLEPTAQKD